MEVQLTVTERARIHSMIKRPRNRTQHHRAEALLALADGHSIEDVAQYHHVGTDRIEAWVEEFSKLRVEYLTDPKQWEELPEHGPEETDSASQ